MTVTKESKPAETVADGLCSSCGGTSQVRGASASEVKNTREKVAGDSSRGSWVHAAPKPCCLGLPWLALQLYLPGEQGGNLAAGGITIKIQTAGGHGL